MTAAGHTAVSLVADGLSVRRSRSFALTDIDLTVSGGEVLILVGPNGSGKSTLAGTLSGLLMPAKGQVRLGDIDLGTLSPRDRARRIGLLPQQARSAWPVSVANLVAFGRIPHGDVPTVPGLTDGPADRAVAAALAALDLTAHADRPVTQLSGGEQARAHLARVLAGEPDVVIADEPIAELDPAYAVQVMAMLRRLARDGRAVLATMHDLSMALRFADRIAVMTEGRIRDLGRPADMADGTALEAAFGIPFRVLRQGDLVGVVPDPHSGAETQSGPHASR